MTQDFIRSLQVRIMQRITVKNVQVIPIVEFHLMKSIININLLKQLRKDLTTSIESLSSATTLFKSIMLRVSISLSVLKDEKKIIKRHQKKLQSLLDEKNKQNNIQASPVVTNLSSHALTNEEYSILQ